MWIVGNGIAELGGGVELEMLVAVADGPSVLESAVLELLLLLLLLFWMPEVPSGVLTGEVRNARISWDRPCQVDMTSR